jgi:hypothetical protein
MEKLATQSIGSLSPFFVTATVALTFVSAPISINTARAQPAVAKYTIHFDKATIPTVNAFWSVTLYDQEGFQAANSLNRFAVSSWMPLQYSADGSLDLHVQNESPGAEKEANWLPSPRGPFNLCLRLYAPKSEALTGKWNPPPAVRNRELAVLATQ